MRAEFPGGATVSRAYLSTDDAELIALFAYSRDAEQFAKARIVEDAASNMTSCWYVVACSYDGRVKFFKQKQAEVEAVK